MIYEYWFRSDGRLFQETREEGYVSVDNGSALSEIVEAIGEVTTYLEYLITVKHCLDNHTPDEIAELYRAAGRASAAVDDLGRMILEGGNLKEAVSSVLDATEFDTKLAVRLGIFSQAKMSRYLALAREIS